MSGSSLREVFVDTLQCASNGFAFFNLSHATLHFTMFNTPIFDLNLEQLAVTPKP